MPGSFVLRSHNSDLCAASCEAATRVALRCSSGATAFAEVSKESALLVDKNISDNKIVIEKLKTDKNLF